MITKKEFKEMSKRVSDKEVKDYVESFSIWLEEQNLCIKENDQLIKNRNEMIKIHQDAVKLTKKENAHYRKHLSFSVKRFRGYVSRKIENQKKD